MAQCPLPPPGTGFVSGPDTRGTLDILYTCVSVIVLSTWNVLHLNVPIRSYPRDWKERFRRNVITGITKTFWMLLNIFSPELLIARSLHQRLLAGKMTRDVKSYVEMDQVDWSMAHSFFAGMRGFEIVFSEGKTMADSFPRSIDRTYGDNLLEKSILKRNALRSMALIGSGLAQFGLTYRWPQNLEPGLGGPSGGGNYAFVQRIDQKLDGHVSRGQDEETPQRPNTPSADGPTPTVSSLTVCETLTEEVDSDKPLAGVALNDINLCRLATTHAHFSYSARWLGPIAWQPDARNWCVAVMAWQEISLRDLTAKQHNILRRNLMALQGSSWRPNAEQLLLARKMGIINKLPHLPADDLEDRSQSDEILKFLSACQILWLVAQVISRGAGKLPIALLEIIALALATCALIIYICLWSKPQDVRTTIQVKAARHPTPHEMISIALGGITFPAETGSLGSPIYASIGDNGVIGNSSEHYKYWYMGGLAIGSVVFGAFHLIPWNFGFPTLVERMLWRISAVLITFLPAIFFALFALVETALARHRLTRGNKYRAAYDLGKGAEVVLTLVYIVARLYSLVECIRSLFYLPPEAYRSSWLNFLPHFG